MDIGCAPPILYNLLSSCYAMGNPINQTDQNIK